MFICFFTKEHMEEVKEKILDMFLFVKIYIG